MVVRQKNLLDAFRRAAPDARPAATPSVPSSSGGPFAPSKSPELRLEPIRSSPASSPASSLGEFGEPGASSAPTASSRRLRAGILIALLIGCGAYAVARFTPKSGSTGNAPAAGDSVGADSAHGALSAGLAAGSDLVERNEAAARMGTAADKAMMDPANKFTIQLIQYKNDDAGQKRARETAEYLRKQAIPVVSPISYGKNVLVVADAKPRKDDLAALLKHVQALPGPPPQDKQTPFSSALVVNIDKIVKRR
jgi:hypothetical protein